MVKQKIFWCFKVGIVFLFLMSLEFIFIKNLWNSFLLMLIFVQWLEFLNFIWMKLLFKWNSLNRMVLMFTSNSKHVWAQINFQILSYMMSKFCFKSFSACLTQTCLPLFSFLIHSADPQSIEVVIFAHVSVRTSPLFKISQHKPNVAWK